MYISLKIDVVEQVCEVAGVGDTRSECEAMVTREPDLYFRTFDLSRKSDQVAKDIVDWFRGLGIPRRTACELGVGLFKALEAGAQE